MTRPPRNDGYLLWVISTIPGLRVIDGCVHALDYTETWANQLAGTAPYDAALAIRRKELDWRRAGRRLVNAPRRIKGHVIRAANDPAFRNAVAGMKHLLLTGFSTDCLHEAADAAIRDPDVQRALRGKQLDAAA